MNGSAARLRPATEADIEAIGALRRQVGWHVYPWALRDAMRAPHARCLVALDGDGGVVAVGSGIAYGGLGIVGNMVVDRAHRRRGLGSRILREVIAFLEERGCEQLELHATDDGRRLYRHYGFEPAGEQVRARLPRSRLPPSGRVALRGAHPSDQVALATWDEPRFGGDRGPILAAAIADPERHVRLAIRAGELAGYAVVRPDGRLGPWVADDLETAASLLSDAGRLLPDVETFSTGAPGENADGLAWLAGLGAELDPHDGRMRRGSGVRRRLETVYGNAIGALG